METLTKALTDVFHVSASRTGNVEALISGQSSDGMAVDTAEVARLDGGSTPDLALEGAANQVTGTSFVETDAARWHQDIRTHHLEGPLAKIVHQLTGSQQLVLYSDQLFYKGAGSRVKTPWHQDKPYFLVDGGEMAVAWVPVDVVDKAVSAMGYVRGSHLWGKSFKPSDFKTESGTFPEVGGIDHSELEQLDLDRLPQAKIVYFDAEPGDVIVHHSATLHCSTGNTSSDRIRRAASVRFACDGCRYLPRRSSPEPFRNTIDIAPGAKLESSERWTQAWP